MAFFPYTKIPTTGAGWWIFTHNSRRFLSELWCSLVPPNVFRDHLVPLKELLCVCPTTWWIWWLASMTSCWAGKSTKMTWELTWTNISPYQPALLKRIFSVSQGGICDRFLEAFWQVDAGWYGILGMQRPNSRQAASIKPIPIPSMRLVCLPTFGWLIFMANVGKYTISTWILWDHI